MLDFKQIQTDLPTSAMNGYDDHWLQDPNRDRPLGHRWKMAEIELAKALRLPKMKTKTADDVLHLIAADIIMSERMHPGRRISYSRSDGFYKQRRQYTPEGFNLANVTAAIDLLEKLGYIVDHERRPPGHRGTQSSFRPNPSLSMLLLPAVALPVKNEVIMKDRDGNVVSYEDKGKSDGQRKGPSFSGRIHDMRAVVRKVNEVLADTDIVLDAEGVVADGEWLRKGDYVMYPALKSLYRVFNGGWRLGGRFYGGWWQGVKSEDRRYFLLNGERTEEIDYSQIHPRIIYKEAGVELVGDAYEIPGWSGTKELRDLCKAAFNILVNAACYDSARGALARDMGGDRQGAAELIEAIKAKHRDVAYYFHSAVGVRLQGLDSKMAEIVLAEMTVKRGIPVLPVHDSFIVAESHRETLVRVMKDAFERVVGKTSNRDKIVKSSIGNTPVKTSSYGYTDYKQNSPSPGSSPLAPSSISDSDLSAVSAVSVVDSSPVPAVESFTFGTPAPAVESPKSVIRRPAPAFLRAGPSETIDWEAKSAAKDAERASKRAQASP